MDALEKLGWTKTVDLFDENRKTYTYESKELPNIYITFEDGRQCVYFECYNDLGDYEAVPLCRDEIKALAKVLEEL